MVVKFNDIVLEGGGKEGDGGDDQEGNAVVNSGGGYSYIVIGYSKHIGRVFKEKIKNITFTDVFRCAKEKLEKNNLKVTRHIRLVCREK